LGGSWVEDPKGGPVWITEHCDCPDPR
jgi:hypothetical protein